MLIYKQGLFFVYTADCMHVYMTFYLNSQINILFLFQYSISGNSEIVSEILSVKLVNRSFHKKSLSFSSNPWVRHMHTFVTSINSNIKRSKVDKYSMGEKHAYKSGITTITAQFTILSNHAVILIGLCPLRFRYIRTSTLRLPNICFATQKEK